MAKRIGVFCDVSNLYYCIQKKFLRRKLDYRKYYGFIKDLGEIQQAICYGAQMAGQADSFMYCLNKIGFQTKYKAPKTYTEDGSIKRKADWDVGIAMDIVGMIDRFDMIVLGTGDGDMVPLVDWCRAKGVDVVILGTGISVDLKKAATKAIEIPESLLETEKPKGAFRPRELAEQKLADQKRIPDTVVMGSIQDENLHREQDTCGIQGGMDRLPTCGSNPIPCGHTLDCGDHISTMEPVMEEHTATKEQGVV